MQTDPDDASAPRWTQISGLSELVMSLAFIVLFKVAVWLVRVVARRIGMTEDETSAFVSVLALGAFGAVVVVLTVRELFRARRDYPTGPSGDELRRLN